MRRDHDVLIAGAGPAGAHLAIRLARAGWSVALLDKQRFPRRKPCGEFLGPECLPLLEELGLLAPLEARGARRIDGLRLFGHGQRACGRYGGLGHGTLDLGHGLAVPREELDLLAVRVAEREPGVELLLGHALGELLREADGRVVGARVRDPSGEKRELRAAFTIGADGLQSRVARGLGVWRRVGWLDRFALSTRVARADLGAQAEVHFVPGGYLAIAPVSAARATLNLVVERNGLPRGHAGLRAFLEAHLALAPELCERVRLEPEERILTCGPLASATSAQTFDGAALLGDACGYVDPLTGEGTYFAMRGARLLAECLADALHARRADRAALVDYDRARAREFRHRRALGFLLQRGLRHPALVRGVLQLFAARPRLADLLVGMTGSGVRPRALLAPSTWLDVLRAAPRRPAETAAELLPPLRTGRRASA